MPSSTTDSVASTTKTTGDLKEPTANHPNYPSASPYHAELEPVTSRTGAHNLPDPGEEPDAELEKALDQHEKPPPALDPSAFPDGGAKAWLAVLGGFFCMFCSFGWINCIGVFQDYYTTHMLKQYSPSVVAWIPSLEAFMMFFGGPFIGAIYDNFGPRYLLLAGSFFHVFGIMMTSLAKKYYQFILAQGICSALGASCVFYPAMTCVSTWFFKKRALAMGIMASGSSLGGVIFPIMVEHLIGDVDFGWTMRICGFLILALLTISNATLTSRLPPTRKPVVLSDFVTPFTEVPFVLVTFGGFLFFFGMFLPFNFVISEAVEIGMSQRLAGYLLAVLNADSTFGRIIPGYLGDKLGRFNVLTVMSYFAGILVLALWLPAKANAPIIVFSGLYGFASGAFVSMIPACVAQISDIRKIGVRNGALFAVVSFAALTGSPIGGALVSHHHGSYKQLQIFAGVMLLAGSTCFLMARMVLAGPTLKKV
ncbi:MFS general substrate transporter [Xylona heveae TC161]|uniref:MFS general substrate transporter n=1 Tax=Xylona heveae (strain CBS 132557 / TC161) TaxID=1328760 RepID=A0A165G981_XYLHT|nr:MFS general substrate transporter [Xylona heveae TC161]KZF21899.1 MFS general substrate transporter [Xylona heveae TC161]